MYTHLSSSSAFCDLAIQWGISATSTDAAAWNPTIGSWPSVSRTLIEQRRAASENSVGGHGRAAAAARRRGEFKS